jgi:peptidoglycan/xylan/chitin deacetylase (PgdA/CDA1 family)
MTPIPILMYHQIDKAPVKGTPMRGLVVSPLTFYTHMMIMWLCGYRGLSMSELLPYLEGKKSGKVFGITFDDGYLNNLIHAAPILKRFGFSSTCYIVANKIGTTNEWDKVNGIPQVLLMNVEQIKAWIAAGQEVGSHGMNHLNLKALPTEQQRHEIEQSRIELEALLDNKTPVQHFCYPYGAYNQDTVHLANNAGYITATTIARARVFDGQNTHLLELPRVLVSRTTTWVHLLLKCFTRYEVKR